MTVFTETPRLFLRSLEESDLPRVTELLGDWDVVQWLATVPYPYALKDAEEFFAKQAQLYSAGKPEYFVMAAKADNQIMGGIGLRPEVPDPAPDDGALGYWLGKPYWQQGFMSEAVEAIVEYAFDRQPKRETITATADIANQASQGVLRKVGFGYLGLRLRTGEALRGGPEVTCWRMDRESFDNRIIL